MSTELIRHRRRILASRPRRAPAIHPCLLALAVVLSACGAPPGNQATENTPAADRSDAPQQVATGAAEVLMPAPDLSGIELRNQHDEPVSLASLRGKPTLLTFIYTRCPMPEMCPATTLRFQEVQRALSDLGRADVRLLSVSFDPAYDTPAVLAEYATLWGVDDTVWTMLTGDEANVQRVAAAYGVWFEKGVDGNFRHPMYSMILLPDGALHRVLLGSSWDAAEVADRLRDLVADSATTPR